MEHTKTLQNNICGQSNIVQVLMGGYKEKGSCMVLYGWPIWDM